MKPSQINQIMYYSAMVGCSRAIPPEELEALRAWEEVHVDGSGGYCTSDWPGWEKFIGKMPEHEELISDQSGFVYVIESGADSYKIGISKSILERIASLQTGNPEKLRLIHSFWATDARAVECSLHKRFAHCKLRNEWFNLSTTDLAYLLALGNENIFSLGGS
jgi:hypothetical protein